MQTLTINIKNSGLTEKVIWLLEHFKKDGLEIIDFEDIEDLKLLSETRKEKHIAFDEYLNHEN